MTALTYFLNADWGFSLTETEVLSPSGTKKKWVGALPGGKHIGKDCKLAYITYIQ